MKTYIERAAVLKYSKAMLNLAEQRIQSGKAESDVWKAIHQTQEEERREFVSLLENAPAAEVVEVVRCQNCLYYPTAKVNEKGFLICPASGMEITEADYCSYGERKIETVLPKSDAKDESLEADHEVSKNH